MLSGEEETNFVHYIRCFTKRSKILFTTLGENRALAANQSVDCHATILFTISLNSTKVENRRFNWPVFSVGMHKKSPDAFSQYVNSAPVTISTEG